MAEFVAGVIEQTGYAGIFLLMLAENLFPPIPSEVVLPFAGLLAARGTLDPVLVVLAGTLGALLGALPWYVLGWFLSTERLERLVARFGVYLSVTTDDLARATRFFATFQYLAVFLGRLAPIIRTVISVPAGSIRMHTSSFLLLTALGSALWNTGLVAAGYILEDQYARVGAYVDPVAYGIIALVLTAYVYRIVRYHVRRRNEPPHA